MIAKVSRRLLNQQAAFGFSKAEGHVATKMSALDEEYLTQVRKRYVTADVESWAILDYKKPASATVSHFDPKSKDYIESERDEYAADIVINSHNRLVNTFKHDLKMQNKVNDILSKMDRPYLRGIAGRTKTISAGLQDYSTPVEDHVSHFDINSFYAGAYKNENRWID